MRMRWLFHNLLLQLWESKMIFSKTDFAGRILSAKVMQTALAVREFWMILGDMFFYVLIYFYYDYFVLGFYFTCFNHFPLFFIVDLIYRDCQLKIPRLGKVSQQQADARAIMTGRVTDAYTNIQTVKLFAHAGRESQYAKESMQIYGHCL